MKIIWVFSYSGRVKSPEWRPFVYGYRSSCPHAHCTPNKSVPTLHYTCRQYIQVYARRHLPSAVLWISEDHLFCAAWLCLWLYPHHSSAVSVSCSKYCCEAHVGRFLLSAQHPSLKSVPCGSYFQQFDTIFLPSCMRETTKINRACAEMITIHSELLQANPKSQLRCITVSGK